MQFPFELKKTAEFDVIGFGTNAVDYLIRVPTYPVFNSKVEVIDYEQAAGGEIATSMVGLQRLGLSCSYIGRFGSDAEGDLGIGSLRDAGVDTTYSERVDGARTQKAFIIIDEQNGERTVIWKRDAKLGFSEDEAPVEVVRRGRVLHFTPHDTRACIRLAKDARISGAVVSIDIDSVVSDIDELLGTVDIVIASAEFPEKLLGMSDKRASLLEMQRRYGAAVVGVTLGESGSLLLCNGEFIETTGFEVPGGCKDTTGAGDSFRVGLLYGLLTGRTVEESARTANAVAALKCRAVGARTALPTEAELDAFMKKT